MAKEEPAAGEDSLQLLLVNLFLNEDAPAQHAFLGGNQT
jgi:hypothetical protein